MNPVKKFGGFLAAAIVLAVVFALGFYTGLQTPSDGKISGILSTAPQIGTNREEIDFSQFWHAWNIVEGKYVDIEKISRQDMVYGAIAGLLKSLNDPYSVFFTPEEAKIFESEIKGEFEGVGMEIGMRRDVLTVIAPLKGTPADKAGVRAGDKILKIDDEITADMTIDQAVRRIRGQRGTKVKLTILRNGEDESRVVEIERGLIKIPTIDTETKQTIATKEGERVEQDLGNIFIIRLYNFSENSTNSFRGALREMLEKNKSKLIIDLRNNPGGFLEAAVDIASWFLPQGEVVAKENFGNKTDLVAHRSRGYQVFKDTPVIILVNQGTASASEILAGALRDHGKAKIIGERTFGKGSVQEFLPLDAETSIKITISKWLTPSGQTLSDGGLEPDIEIKPAKEDIEAGRDPAMERAIEILRNL